MSLQTQHKGHNSNINLSVRQYHIQNTLSNHTKGGKSMIILQKSPYPKYHKVCSSTVYIYRYMYIVPEAVRLNCHQHPSAQYLNQGVLPVYTYLTCCGGTLNALIFMSTFLQLSTQGKINTIPVNTNIVLKII